MAFISRLRAVGDFNKARAVRELVEHSTPDFDFFFMIVLSVLMATLGLLVNSEAIVIGAMLIAPLLYSVLGLAVGASMSNYELFGRSLRTVAKATAIAIASATVATLLFSFSNVSDGLNEAIMLRANPSLLFLFVSIISGVAVAYSMVRPGLSETLPGVAVSVALIPPLAVAGIGIATFNWAIVSGASVMFGVNVLGIVTSAMFLFSLMNVHDKQHVAHSAIKKEEKRVEEERYIEKIIEEKQSD